MGKSYQSLERPALPQRPLTERFFVPFTYVENWTLFLLFVFAIPLGVLVIAGVTIFFGGGVAMLTVGMPVGAVLVATSCYFATFLLHVYSFTSSGMDAKEFKEWLPPMDYLVNGYWLFTFSCIAAAPGYLIGKFFVSEVLLIILMMQISHWLFFPIAFLSSMESGSMFAVFAKNTMVSLFRFPFAWFRFYCLTGTLFILAELSLIGALWLDSTGSMFFVTLAVFCFIGVIQSLFFFRFLGRLAWLIEETDRRRRELKEEQD